MISIREVAKLAGVSPATVSRVLNGTARVDAEKEKRIKKVIEETGYVPNEVARSLFKHSSKLIGLIVPNIQNPFFSQLARLVENAAYQKGYRIVLCNTNEIHMKEIESVQMLKRMNADGIIITSTDAKLQLEAEKASIPVVIMDRQLPDTKGLACLMADHYQGGRIAMEHLLECGCKNIVNIKGPQLFSSGQARYKGYKDVCAELGIKEQTVECEYNYKAGIVATEEVLKKYPDVDGIIACNDIVAVAAIKVLYRNEKIVPDDIQIIGFDNIEWSTMLIPELTTIMQPTDEMAEKAIELLVQETEKTEENKLNESQQFVFPVRLIKRGTTK